MSEIVVIPARNGTIRYWIRSGLGNLLALLTGGAELDDDNEAPAVAWQRSDGTYAVLLRTGTLRQAKEASYRFERELEVIGPEEFQSKYGVT